VRDLNAPAARTSLCAISSHGRHDRTAKFVSEQACELRPTSWSNGSGEEAAKQARAVLDGGADWVKVFASTGGFDNVTGDQTGEYQEMKADCRHGPRGLAVK